MLQGGIRGTGSRNRGSTHTESPLPCGYPEWSIRKVKSELEAKTQKTKKQHKLVQGHETLVIIPYVEGVSESVARVYIRYGVSSAMKPHTTIRNLLVHPKDKVNTEETAKCVYRTPCKNCQKVYIGETGRSFGVRMKEQKITSSTGTRQQSSPVSLTELHGGSGKLSRFVRRAKASWTEMRASTSWVISNDKLLLPLQTSSREQSFRRRKRLLPKRQ